MVFHKSNRDALDFWVERRIKEAYLRNTVLDLSKNQENIALQSAIHSSFWTVFKNGARTI